MDHLWCGEGALRDEISRYISNETLAGLFICIRYSHQGESPRWYNKREKLWWHNLREDNEENIENSTVGGTIQPCLNSSNVSSEIVSALN